MKSETQAFKEPGNAQQVLFNRKALQIMPSIEVLQSLLAEVTGP